MYMEYVHMFAGSLDTNFNEEASVTCLQVAVSGPVSP